MKAIKIVAVILSLALLCSCSSIPTPKRAHIHIIEAPLADYAKEAIRICDDYLSFAISTDEAKSRAEELWNRAEYLEDRYGILSAEHAVCWDIETLRWDFYDKDDEDIRETRDGIAAYCGLPISGVKSPGYSGDDVDKLEALGFDAKYVYDFKPVGTIDDRDGFEYTSNFVTFNGSVTDDMSIFETQMLAALGNIESDKNAAKLNVYYYKNINAPSTGSVCASFSRGSTGLSCRFDVKAEDGDFDVYCFEYAIKGRPRIVYQQDEGLTVEEAAQFFVDCMPE